MTVTFRIATMSLLPLLRRLRQDDPFSQPAVLVSLPDNSGMIAAFAR